jgi:imidazolonepropionase-like amidohydrolase
MRILKLSFLLAILSLSCQKEDSIIIENGLIIENVTILTPKDGSYSTFKGNVIIDNDKIINVSENLKTIKGTFQTVDGTGKYIIPGLIDSHVHLASIAGMNQKHKQKYPDFAKSYYNQLPKSYLYYGYTTLIDVNNYNPRIIKNLLKKEIRPDIYTCGDQVVIDHDLMMNESANEDRFNEYPNFLHDSFNDNAKIPDSIDASKHTSKAIVSRIVDENGGICVKTLYEDGFGGTEELTWELPSKEIIKEIVQEAHQQNIPVLLHANAYAAQKFGVETGVDILAHGMWHWGNLIEYLNVNELPETHKALLIEIAKRKIGYQPTIRVVGGQKDVFDATFLNNENLNHVYPKPLLDWLNTDEGHWQEQNIKKYAKSFFDGLSNEDIMAIMQKVVDKVEISTKTLADNDANLIFGTDTPASNTHTMPPGLNGYLEMRKWSQVGVTLEQILLSATINNAKAFHIENNYGSIENSKIANLILLNKNPLETIEAYNSIDKVIIRGQLLDRKNLSATKN